MTGEFRSVYIAGSSAEAHLLANALKDRGIEAFVENDILQAGRGLLPFGLSTAPRVVVAEKQCVAAHEIVLELVQVPVASKPSWQFGMRTMMLIVTVFCIYLVVYQLLGGNDAISFLVSFPGAVLHLAYYAAVLVLIVRFVRGRRSRALATEKLQSELN